VGSQTEIVEVLLGERNPRTRPHFCAIDRPRLCFDNLLGSSGSGEVKIHALTAIVEIAVKGL
jgi:hypothetical protein